MGQSRPFSIQAQHEQAELVDLVLKAAESMSKEEILDLADALHDLLRSRRSDAWSRQHLTEARPAI